MLISAKNLLTAAVRNDHSSDVEQSWLCSVMCSLGFSGPAQSLSPAAVTALFWFLTVRGRALGQEATDDGSDSEEELAAFCPKVTEPLGEGRAQQERTNHTVGTCSIWLCVRTV